MKIFIWLFLAMGAVAPLGLVAGLLGTEFRLSLYGFQTNHPLSPTGLFITILFILKGIVAFGLWTEKDWGVKLGMIDAITGIVICGFVMVIYPFFNWKAGFEINFRFELVALIPYLLRLQKIKTQWIR